jgi:uncharacterized protein YukE
MWPFNKLSTGSSPNRVSLSGQIASFGDLEEIMDTALAGYRAALDSVVMHTPKMLRDQSTDLKKNLRQIRARLEGQPSTALLRETVKEVDRELANWGKRTEASFEAQEKETKDAMAAVAVMAEALGAHEKTYGVRFRGISKTLRVLTTSNDISEIRKKLQGEIELLEQYVNQMTQESESALGRLKDLDDQRRARMATDKAAADKAAAAEVGGALGGDDRRRLSDAVRSQIKTEDRVAIVRLQAPEPIAAKGHSLIVERLRDVFESPLLTGQWSPESFVSITRLPLPEAAARLEIVERDLSVKLGGKLDGTVFEKTPGSTPSELLGRFESSPKIAA